MSWRPEGTVSIDERESTKLEWLLRNFRKLSQWSDTRVAAGYGGLFLASPEVILATLTTTYQKINILDTEDVEQPIGVIQDVDNDRIAITEPGVWNFHFDATGENVPFSSNAAQGVTLAAYNETKGIPLIVGHCAIARYVEVFHITMAGMARVPDPSGLLDIGDYISLWLRQRQATPTIVVDAVEQAGLYAFRVSA